ncbi:uncharacterized protein LOC130738335 [Lotus japonicus]|uniref:uncharacterized protein LOC130738335 n=1 Tax=Lotus japonicus TaxID=34305 RepID=UPI002590DF92|nr:uncharacterized protein LOC130738335 [Lotus japonicus]XP_057446286.1 uncharacterized protein LOC130738335 [Lotus japonicus]XP_057446287.1 uncharacterized protein LOC130738335 [Lotus japonicus]XP_057446288.1 uncharacterized protein LOC130738335 [Lotus japonicus]XP_057446289.1 uncharacterized protein LOC130738335 [Lotus japonicus]XP_057446290.1 uncharacterized protein LOC130738335 [Lotus japonicus]
MMETISECGNFLVQELSDVKPSTVLTFGTAHLVWVRLWQVPLGLWTESFFTAMGNRLGSFVESDEDTKLRLRADYARILIRMHHPLLHCFTMAVDVNGVSSIILVEKDDVPYDYGMVHGMPSTPWKIYNSEEDNVTEDDEDYNDAKETEAARHVDVVTSPNDKDYESPVDVEPDEEDEVYRNERMEGLKVILAKSLSKQEEEALAIDDDGGWTSTPEVVVLPRMASAPGLPEADSLISNSNVSKEAINTEEIQKEQLQVLLDSGYTLQELEGWRNKTNAAEITLKGNHILNEVFQNSDSNNNKRYSVTGYSFNSQDLFPNYYLPYQSTKWDPFRVQVQVQGLKPCLPHGLNQKQFIMPTLASQEKNDVDVFVHTSPNQIVRQQFPFVRESGPTQTPQKSALPLTCVEADAPETPAVVITPNTNSSKRSSQRGRPRGSKNKPQSLPAGFLEPVAGEDGVSTRAQRAWLIGKQLGLKPRGSEALMLRGLEAQIRENHPHLK